MKPTGSPAATRSRSTGGSRRSNPRRRFQHGAYPVHIENDIAFRIYFEGGSKSRAPLELVIAVRIARVDCLAEGIVETFDQDHQLRLERFDVLGGLPV